MDYFVEIVERQTEKVEERMGPFDERMAARVRSGAQINLNREDYLVRLVPVTS
jgi:hypothetical protein